MSHPSHLPTTPAIPPPLSPSPSPSPPPASINPTHPSSPYLESLINRTLKVSTNDGRAFVGVLKCTDKDKNLILAHTFEHRPSTEEPSEPEEKEPPAATRDDPLSVIEAAKRRIAREAKEMKGKRYIGLVVVPGRCIIGVGVDEKRPVVAPGWGGIEGVGGTDESGMGW